MSSSHQDLVKREFTSQASKFADRGLTLAREDYLRWMVQQLPLAPTMKVLDVAAGTGHLGRAIAPYAAEVVCLDVTPAMLEEGRREAARAGLANVRFIEGQAETLPFAEHEFQLVVCRFALHHFPELAVPLREMKRVCAVGGHLGLIDLLAPDERAAEYDRFERLRDPSHARSLTRGELLQLPATLGMEAVSSDFREVEVDVERWLALTHTPQAQGEEIRKAIEAELSGGTATGLEPFVSEGRLMFRQRWGVVVSRA
ncbi:MAG TPA: methyltransferase domain-containing protein [Myxococcaceae bacterium]|jgi:ubiquinone/menaquinone biosynthesis C-methylase UbiE